jgi:hypothetical protein
MATISEISTQAQTITLLHMLPIIGASTLGTAFEWRRRPHE